MLELIVLAALVVGIPALFLSVVRSALARNDAEEMPAWFRGLFRGRPLATGWYVIAAFLGLIVLMTALNAGPRGPRREEGLFFLTLVLAALGLFAHVWRREFLLLMNRRDDEFPGRFDKLTWTLLLIVMPPVGVWFFRTYRLVRWPEPKAKWAGGEAAAELS